MSAKAFSVNKGEPQASSSKMICNKMLRVRSWLFLASTTWMGTPSITHCLMSASVMYEEDALSYRRRLGYFLITRVDEASATRVSGDFLTILLLSCGDLLKDFEPF